MPPRACAGCAGRGISATGVYEVAGEMFCERCFADDDKQQPPDTPPDTPGEMIAMARRGRLYYGLLTEAARHLRVNRLYISSVLGLRRINANGRLGHRRVFSGVADLVRECEAGTATVSGLGLNGGRFYMRGEYALKVDDVTAAVSVSQSANGGALQFQAYGERGALERGLRVLERMLINPSPDDPRIELVDARFPCVRCGAHVLIVWRGARVSFVYDSRPALPPSVRGVIDAWEDECERDGLIHRARRVADMRSLAHL